MRTNKYHDAGKARDASVALQIHTSRFTNTHQSLYNISRFTVTVSPFTVTGVSSSRFAVTGISRFTVTGEQVRKNKYHDAGKAREALAPLLERSSDSCQLL